MAPSHYQILTVGAEPLLRRFDLNGALLSQIHCAPCSVFSISLHPAGVCFQSLLFSLFPIYVFAYDFKSSIYPECYCEFVIVNLLPLLE